MQTFSEDLRLRVLSLDRRGYRTGWIAQTLEVGETWVRRVKRRWREYGETTARPRGGSVATKVDHRHLAELIEAQPDATLKELRDRLGVECSLATVWNACRRLGHTFKKSRSMPPNRTVRTSRISGPGGEIRHGSGCLVG